MAICAEAKLDCVLTPIPWDGLIPGLKTKKIDAIMNSMSITAEREKEIDFSNKYYNTPTSIAGAKDQKFDASPEGLKGKIIGVQVSTVHAAYAKKHFGGSAAEIKEYQTQDEANQDLIAGRIDATQADGIALGTGAQSNGIQSVAIGAGATANNSGSVALGAGAATSVGSQTGYTAYGLAAPQNSAGEVSVGTAGAERKVTNVAAGSAATDAVNVSQLQAVDGKVTQVANNVTNLGDSIANSFGGGSTYDPGTGTVTTQLNVGGTTYNNVNDALQAVGATASAGWNIQANGGPSTNVGSNGTLNVTAGANTVVTLIFDSVPERIAAPIAGPAADDSATTRAFQPIAVPSC